MIEITVPAWITVAHVVGTITFGFFLALFSFVTWAMIGDRSWWALFFGGISVGLIILLLSIWGQIVWVFQ